jgi:hypothetical protein
MGEAMLSRRRAARYLAMGVACVGVLMLHGCLGWGDMFAERRAIGSKYYLMEGENPNPEHHDFYLFERGNDVSVAGPLACIGWDSDYILLRAANDPTSWTLLAVDPQRLAVPASVEDRKKMAERLSRSLKIETPQQAWRRAER